MGFSKNLLYWIWKLQVFWNFSVSYSSLMSFWHMFSRDHPTIFTFLESVEKLIFSFVQKSSLILEIWFDFIAINNLIFFKSTLYLYSLKPLERWNENILSLSSFMIIDPSEFSPQKFIFLKIYPLLITYKEWFISYDLQFYFHFLKNRKSLSSSSSQSNFYWGTLECPVLLNATKPQVWRRQNISLFTTPEKLLLILIILDTYLK